MLNGQATKILEHPLYAYAMWPQNSGYELPCVACMHIIIIIALHVFSCIPRGYRRGEIKDPAWCTFIIIIMHVL